MWHDNWPWSIPLIVLTVIIHVVGLGLFNVKMVQVLTAVKDRPHFTSAFALVIGFTAIWATFLHAIEAGIWAGGLFASQSTARWPHSYAVFGERHHDLRSFTNFSDR